MNEEKIVPKTELTVKEKIGNKINNVGAVVIIWVATNFFMGALSDRDNVLLLSGLVILGIQIFVFDWKSRLYNSILRTWIVVFFIIYLFFEVSFVNSSSMEPNDNVGNIIVINKIPYGYKIPFGLYQYISDKPLIYGDKLAFKYNNAIYIKRLIANSGDVIEYNGKTISVNGSEYKQDYLGDYKNDLKMYKETNSLGVEYDVLINHKSKPLLIDQKRGDWVDKNCSYWAEDGFKCTIPDNELFFMGDNRDDSLDGRYFGGIKREDIYGSY